MVSIFSNDTKPPFVASQITVSSFVREWSVSVLPFSSTVFHEAVFLLQNPSKPADLRACVQRDVCDDGRYAHNRRPIPHKCCRLANFAFGYFNFINKMFLLV